MTMIIFHQTKVGYKLGVSLDNGFAYINNLSWNAYHEEKDLIPQVEFYFKTHEDHCIRI
jgi:hypothetical protein